MRVISLWLILIYVFLIVLRQIKYLSEVNQLWQNLMNRGNTHLVVWWLEWRTAQSGVTDHEIRFVYTVGS
jgi:hypothetical protein